MSDPYLDALEQLDQMRDRAFKAEAAITRVREVCDKDSFWINHAKTGGWGKALTVAQVLAALDGDSDD